VNVNAHLAGIGICADGPYFEETPRRSRNALRDLHKRKVWILNMDSLKGRAHRQKELSNKVMILKTDSPEGETPQTETNLYLHEFAEYIYIYIYIYILICT